MIRTKSRRKLLGASVLALSAILGACNLPSALQSAETPAPSIIRGVVWHDLCAVPESEGEGLTSPPEGCVPLPDGGYRGNGTLDPGEPGVAGVQVDLGAGPCPSTGLRSVDTGKDGSFAFVGHEPGSYCVSIDLTDPMNSSILIPGEWTFPATGQAMTTIEVTEGEDHSGVNFGWDFQLLPAPPTVEPSPTSTTGPEMTPTSDQPTVTARVNANCRFGPGLVYDVISFLLAGQSTVAEGRNGDGSWWYVRRVEGGGNCWIANSVVDINFTPSSLPVIAAPPTPTPGPSSISGLVWHDLCAPGGEGEEATPTAGCVADGNGGHRANGVLDTGEPGIAGVRVELGTEACPSSGLATTTTDANGHFTFASLGGGTYCVSIDAGATPNADVLNPGSWTHPAVSSQVSISVTVALSAGEKKEGVNFGWDYQLLP